MLKARWPIVMLLVMMHADDGGRLGQLPGQHGAGVPHQHGSWECLLVRAYMHAEEPP